MRRFETALLTPASNDRRPVFVLIARAPAVTPICSATESTTLPVLCVPLSAIIPRIGLCMSAVLRMPLTPPPRARPITVQGRRGEGPAPVE